jgi:DNA polymerase-3 subunit epsilon
MEFVALDVETANADRSSICQIGLAHFMDGSVREEWVTYVDPEDCFDGFNTSIHGIDESTVKGAPIFPDVADRMSRHLEGRVAVCHTAFDRVATYQAATKYDLPVPACTWLDSARVARRTWQEFSQSGYGLASVCAALGYQFAHHDALEDAKAAAHILLAAIAKTGLSVQDWLLRVEQPIDFCSRVGHTAGRVAREGDPQGPLFGEVVVFTGALGVPRPQAAEIAARAGCSVAEGVTKGTTILVVGDQDVRKLAGHEKSSKQRKAEALIRDGHSIHILTESNFRELVTLFAVAQ